MTPTTFQLGDAVKKSGGDYIFPGMVVGVIEKLSGAIRYVVEDDRGILHIFSDKQLAVDPDGIAPPLTPAPTGETARERLRELRDSIQVHVESIKPALAPVGGYSSKSVGEAMDRIMTLINQTLQENTAHHVADRNLVGDGTGVGLAARGVASLSPVGPAQPRESEVAGEIAETLRKCAEQFRLYERLHLSKPNGEGWEKAKTNAAMAEMCERVLRQRTEAGQA